MNNSVYVYWLHLPHQTNMFGEGYIGVSKNPQKRLYQHKRIDKNKRHENYNLSNAFKTYDNIKLDIILEAEENYCYLIENKLRPCKNIGWNINEGGDKPPKIYGKKPYISEMLRKRVGENHHFFGKHHTEDSNKKRSESLKNSDHRVHIEGHTEETKNKMSKNCPKNTQGKKWFHDPNSGKSNFFFVECQPSGWLLGRK